MIIYVILAIVLVVVILGALLARRKSTKRGMSYAPDVNLLPHAAFQGGGRPGPGPLPEVAVPTPELTTEAMAHDEYAGDVTDDLLDPRNPGHEAWVKEHSEMETDAEWVAEHPSEDPPESS